MENTDFDTAVEFFAAGRKYLNNWDVDFKLMLRLCSEEAKACFITGDYDTMNVHINEIMSKDIPITDKFKAYETKILYQQEALQNYQESLDICIDVRKQLGMQVLENKHQSTLKIIYEFIKVNRALGKKTVEELANLPNLTDERLLMGQRMLCLMGNASFSVSVHECSSQPYLSAYMSFSDNLTPFYESRFNPHCFRSFHASRLEKRSSMA